MKRNLLTAIFSFFLSTAGFSQGADLQDILAKIDPMFDLEVLKQLQLTNAQIDKLDKRLGEIGQLARQALTEGRAKVEKIDDPMLRQIETGRIETSLVEAIQALADKVANDLFSAKQEIVYSAFVLARSPQGIGPATMLQPRVQRRLKLTKAQVATMQKEMDAMRAEFSKKPIDPEASEQSLANLGKQNKEIIFATLRKMAGCMDNRQQSIIATTLNIMSNESIKGAQS